MNNEELNKKLAEWVGFKYDNIVGYWYPPGSPKCDGLYITDNKPPNFTSSLDACVKWLVPKTRKISGLVLATSFGKGEEYDAIFPDIDSEPSATDKSLALALCKAIEQLIEKEAGNVET